MAFSKPTIVDDDSSGETGTIADADFMDDYGDRIDAAIDGADAAVRSVALGGTGLSALGTALQVLRVNAGATALEYAAPDSGATWTSPSFSAGNFSGNVSMTWTVESGDVNAYAYAVTGKVMFLAFDILTSTVGGTPAGILKIAIPGGFTAAATGSSQFFMYNDNGGATTVGFANLNSATDGNVLRLAKLDNSNWAAATNTTRVRGMVTLELQ